MIDDPYNLGTVPVHLTDDAKYIDLPDGRTLIVQPGTMPIVVNFDGSKTFYEDEFEVTIQ